MDKIAVVMIHYGLKEITDRAISSLKSKIGQHKLILIDNTVKNIGFAAGVNQGIKQALQDRSITHLLLLNNDTSFVNGSLEQLLTTYHKVPSAGIVSPVLHHAGGYDWGGRFSRYTGMVRHRNWENKPKTIQKVDHVAGAAMLIKRVVIESIGLFDERFFLYFEDVDYCLRAIAAGFTIHINPAVVAEHQVSAGSNPIPRLFHQWRSHILFILKYLPIQVYPTAIIYDSLFYPLVLIKLLLIQFMTIFAKV